MVAFASPDPESIDTILAPRMLGLPRPTGQSSIPTESAGPDPYSGQITNSENRRCFGSSPISSSAARTSRRCATVISSGGSSGW